MKNAVITTQRQTIQDPNGNYDVVYVDVMWGSERIRRFIKPLSKPEIKLSEVIEKAKKYAVSCNYTPIVNEYIGG